MKLQDTRPQSAKTICYRTNGGGRDTYIAINNGGFSAPNETKTNFHRGSFPRNLSFKGSFTQFSPKSLNYHSNGTGRDSYICSSAGGLHKPWSPGEYRTNFYDTLRSYRLFPVSSMKNLGETQSRWKTNTLKGTSKGLIRPTNTHFTEKVQSQIHQYRSYQRQVDLRLSKPKGNYFRYQKTAPKLSRNIAFSQTTNNFQHL